MLNCLDTTTPHQQAIERSTLNSLQWLNHLKTALYWIGALSCLLFPIVGIITSDNLSNMIISAIIGSLIGYLFWRAYKEPAFWGAITLLALSYLFAGF